MKEAFELVWTPTYGISVFAFTVLFSIHLSYIGRKDDIYGPTLKLSPSNIVLFIILQICFNWLYVYNVSQEQSMWYLEHPILLAGVLSIGAYAVLYIICEWIDARWFNMKRK